jgi:hypothetical protein
MCSGMALFALEESKRCAFWAVVALSVLSYTCRRLVLHPVRQDGWNPPPRLKCTTSLKEEPHHQSAYQMRRNKKSELSSTVVTVSVTRVFMTASLFSSML